MASLFLPRLGCHILNLANMHGITFIPAYIPTHLNVEADYLLKEGLVPKWHLFMFIDQVAFHLVGQLEVHLLTSSHTNHYRHYYTFEALG